jgi:hypothetical protein
MISTVEFRLAGQREKAYEGEILCASDSFRRQIVHSFAGLSCKAGVSLCVISLPCIEVRLCGNISTVKMKGGTLEGLRNNVELFENVWNFLSLQISVN